MKEGESRNPFTKRARKLISKAFVAGMDPEEIKAEMRIALGIAQEKGRERITRGELRNLRHTVINIINDRQATEISHGCPPTGGWWEL